MAGITIAASVRDHHPRDKRNAPRSYGDMCSFLPFPGRSWFDVFDYSWGPKISKSNFTEPEDCHYIFLRMADKTHADSAALQERKRLPFRKPKEAPAGFSGPVVNNSAELVVVWGPNVPRSIESLVVERFFLSQSRDWHGVTDKLTALKQVMRMAVHFVLNIASDDHRQARRRRPPAQMLT